MIEDRNIDALKTFHHFTSGTKNHLTDEVNNIAPDIHDYIINFVFGDIYSRDGLSDKEKTIVTIITLMAMGGCEYELETHINTAINIDIEPKKIIDSLIQGLPYAGFPRVINAVKVAQRVFSERGVGLAY
nr:carboxymuconolactone decarboxylase family protein [Providencia stuartii]ELR5082848.1 carboxymuconolactone decarboxylase family protein [Providencia stuartii]